MNLTNITFSIKETEETLWKEPKQKRSRQRVDLILQAARTLIAKNGVEKLGMRELAQESQLPVGTLYQFFKDRNALLACLISQYYEKLDSTIQHRFATINSKEDLIEASSGIVDFVYQSLAEDPVLIEIWRGVQASKTIRHLDMQSSQKNTILLYTVLRPLVKPIHSDQRIHAACFLICDLIGATARTALELPTAEGKLLITEFESIIQNHLTTILE